MLAVIIEVCEPTACIQIKALANFSKKLVYDHNQVTDATRVLKMNG